MNLSKATVLGGCAIVIWGGLIVHGITKAIGESSFYDGFFQGYEDSCNGMKERIICKIKSEQKEDGEND